MADERGPKIGPEDDLRAGANYWDELPEDFRAFLLESAAPISDEVTVSAETPAEPTADAQKADDLKDLEAQLDAVLAKPESEESISTSPQPAAEPKGSAVTEEKERVMREELENDLQAAAFALAREVIGQELQLQPETITDTVRDTLAKIIPVGSPPIGEEERKRIGDSLFEVAFVLARHVIDQEIVLRPDLVVESVREALAKFDHENCVIHLNSADLLIVKEALVKDGSSVGVSFLSDDQIDRGSCIAKNERGTVDTQPSSKLEQLRRNADPDAEESA